MPLSPLDIAIVACYFVGLIIFAISVSARSKSKSSSDYFLASHKLPWYAVGASFIAANISTEHFIGMMGWSFLYGMAVSHWAWGNFATYSVLIWIFLPFYMRGNVSTMPQWLERRYNSTCRYIYAVIEIVGLVVALLGGVLFAGATALSVFVPDLPPWAAVLILAAFAGTYTIYGGLLSAVWAGVLEYILLMLGGLIVAFYTLNKAGGVSNLARELPERFIMFFPADHEMVPWTGMILAFFSVGIWYSCANQFMVQRCLGARSEWDARMGVVMAGFSQALLPLLVVVPGVAAFYLFQDRISDGDQSWPYLVMRFLPSGIRGLVLAGLGSAILSCLSAITNSSSTLFTLDLYHTLLRPHASDRELLRVGRLSGATVLLIGVVIALYLAMKPTITIFALIQSVFFYMAPPISAVFLVGILWSGATPAAATVTLFLGFLVYLPLTIFVIFPNAWMSGFFPFFEHLHVAALKPYNSFMHHTFVIFAFCVLTVVVVSWFTQRKPLEQLRGVIWSRDAFRVPANERRLYHGLRSLKLWWGVMTILLVSLYVITHFQGSQTSWLEAESLKYNASSASQVRVQSRSEISRREHFKLWTGGGQVRFQSRHQDDGITFEVPVERVGRYRLAALVTRGPDYGAFGVSVNDQSVAISYILAEDNIETGEIDVVRRSGKVFDSHHIASTSKSARDPSIAGSYVVRRIDLGEHVFQPGVAHVLFKAKDWRVEKSLIGVDQLTLSRLGD